MKTNVAYYSYYYILIYEQSSSDSGVAPGIEPPRWVSTDERLKMNMISLRKWSNNDDNNYDDERVRDRLSERLNPYISIYYETDRKDTLLPTTPCK